MSPPILATKLYIPLLRPKVVPRPRLIERLNEGHHSGRKLTLVSAPAGFGKTTLVSQWVQAMGRATPPVAIGWLSLDESDNDPTRFLTYFVAAMQTVEADIGETALTALQSQPPQPPLEAVLTSVNQRGRRHPRKTRLHPRRLPPDRSPADSRSPRLFTRPSAATDAPGHYHTLRPVLPYPCPDCVLGAR